MSSFAAELAKIGHNEDVELDGYTAHVQTEVLGRAGTVIRSIALVDGVVKAAKTFPCPKNGSLEEVRVAVQAQHLAMIASVKERGNG